MNHQSVACALPSLSSLQVLGAGWEGRGAVGAGSVEVPSKVSGRTIGRKKLLSRFNFPLPMTGLRSHPGPLQSPSKKP